MKPRFKRPKTRSALLNALSLTCLAALTACSAASSSDPAAPTPTAPAPASDTRAPTAPAPKPPTAAAATAPKMDTATPDPEATPPETVATATFGAGCFWCIEAVLEQLDGVESVVSGYTGGETLNPTYADICTGRSGHAEVVKVTFNPTILPYADLLDWFWKAHDPTTLNRQGADRGTQYRSAIYVHTPDQRRIAELSKRDVQPTFDDPIVTEITDAPTFYPAETNHQGYYVDNDQAGYCRMVIAPKLKKLGLKY